MISTEHILRFPGTSDGLDGAVRELRRILDGRSLPPQHRHDVELVFEELASNIVNYGRSSGEIEAVVRFDHETTLTFVDDGVAFDLRDHPAPPVPTRREDLKIGGLGIMLVKTICSRIDYERTGDRQNRLTVAIPAGEPES